MLHSVIINEVDLLDKYGLCLLADMALPIPTIREIRFTVPGMDGSLDVSTALTGEPAFDDVEISFTLFVKKPDSELCQIRAQLANAYNGRKVKAVFPHDTEHYYSGTFKVGELNGNNSGKIPVKILAAPWRYKITSTTVSRDDLGTAYKQLSLPNERRPVVPTITVAQDTTLLWQGNTYTINAGTHRLPDIQLQAGDNILKAKVPDSGTGSITIEYQEASL